MKHQINMKIKDLLFWWITLFFSVENDSIAKRNHVWFFNIFLNRKEQCEQTNEKTGLTICYITVLLIDVILFHVLSFACCSTSTQGEWYIYFIQCFYPFLHQESGTGFYACVKNCLLKTFLGFTTIFRLCLERKQRYQSMTT